jgi:drug/metabolite transporter (DMT)-like permease
MTRGAAGPEHAVPQNTARGFLFALGGAVTVAVTTFVLAKIAMDREEGFHPGTFAFTWTAAASVYLFAGLAARGRLWYLVLTRRAAGHVLAAGVVGGLAHILFWSGLARLDPAFTAFLMRFAPVLVILLSAAFLGERLSGLEMVAVAVMVAGGCVISLGQWENADARAGVVLVLLSSVAAALWRVLVKARSHHVHPVAANFYRLAISAVLLGPWAWSAGVLDFGVGWDRWAVLLVGALLGPCIGMSLTFNSYRYWDLSRSSMVLMTQPLIVLPFAALMPGPSLTLRQLAGGMVILMGGMWLVWLHRRASAGRGERDG